MSKRHELDRSTMFTALLELSPDYGKLDTRVGEHIVSEALRGWYDSAATDMFKFAREWLRANRPELSIRKGY